MSRSPFKLVLASGLAIALLVFATIYFSRYRQSSLKSGLYQAVVRGDAAAVQALLKQGADANTRAERFNSPVLGEAASQGNDTIVQLLLDKGANIESSSTNGLTPLMYAAMNGRASTVKLLLARGANPKAKHSLGRTALDEVLFRLRLPSKRLLNDPNFKETARLLRQAQGS